MLDPFQPEKEDDVKRLVALQKDVHEYFKKLVRDARGERLKADDPAIFSGEFWAAPGALERGLIDGITDLRAKMRDLFGKEVKLKLVTQRTPWWRPVGGMGFTRAKGGFERFGSDFGADFAEGLIAAAEKRSLWSRFGL